MLLALCRANSHGYKLMEEAATFWQEAINPGTVYRTLRQMEKNGSLESKWDTNTKGPARRSYRLTEAGEAYLDLWMESLEQYQRNVDAFLGRYHRASERDK